MSAFVQVILPLKLGWIPYYRDSRGTARPGDKVRVKFSGREYVGVVSSNAETLPENLSEAKVKPIIGVEEHLHNVSSAEMDLWQKIADYYLCTVGEVYKSAFPAHRMDQEEVKARIEERRLRKIERLERSLAKARTDATRSRYAAELEALKGCRGGVAADGPVEGNGEIVLSEEQERAYSEIKGAFAGNGKPVLLKGVTGSGKTVIYEKLALEVLEYSNVLYLVPEIALSRQLEERLRDRFGDRLMVFHSHETAARKGEVASRIARIGDAMEEADSAKRQGEAKAGEAKAGEAKAQGGYIVLGTRSSLFLPHKNLGLIIVDEEHDSSYKQDSPAPRYNGRDVAVMLSACHKDCRVLLGSATPSLESLYNCRTGRYSLVELRQRYHGAEDSEVEIIDTVVERKKRGMMGSFSYRLIRHINDALAAGGQVMILRARRSYSPALQCEGCGTIPKCPRCNLPLSRHTGSAERMLCHRCGWSAPYTGLCPDCGGELHGIGAGTQKIEEEAEKIWPDLTIARLDSDVATDRKAEAAVIRDFSRGRTRMLIGTQILSKGFDFEGVTLVAVIQADSMLALDDFRADEKAVQLLEQFRGRCGRRGERGLFVIQTANPEHPVYARFKDTDNCPELLGERKEFGYPPFTRLVGVTVNDTDGNRAGRMMAGVANALHIALSMAEADGSAVFTGPCGNRLYVALAKDGALARNKRALAGAVARFEREYGYLDHIQIDVDPA